MSQWWGWTLAVMGSGAMWLSGRKRWEGWALAAVNECLWIAYAVLVKQWGLVVGSVIYMAVFVWNLYQWRRGAHHR